MNLIEQMYLILYLLSILKHSSRDNVEIEKLNIIKDVVIRLIKFCTDPLCKMRLEDLFMSINSIDESNYLYLPNEIKNCLLDSILEIKYILAKDAFLYYTLNDFEVNEDSIEVMREIVCSVLLEG